MNFANMSSLQKCPVLDTVSLQATLETKAVFQDAKKRTDGPLLLHKMELVLY